MRKFSVRVPDDKDTVSLGVTVSREMNDKIWSLSVGLKKKSGKNLTKADVIRQMIQHCIESMEEGQYR